jgi:hypothetical protein
MACVESSESIELSVSLGELTADLIVDPGAGLPPNLLEVNPAGVYVIGADGWIPLPANLAYVSASSPTYVATTSADLTSFISPGCKVKLTQAATVRYFEVVAITATQITLYGGDAQVLANSAITAVEFSYAPLPFAFPALTCTTLPIVAYDGMEIRYIAVAGDIEWELRYNGAFSSSKWVVVGGGPPITAEAGTEVSTTSATYVDLGGPSIVVPLKGEYEIAWGGAAETSAGNKECLISFSNGATAANDGAKVLHVSPTNGSEYDSLGRAGRTITVAANGDTVKLMYRSDAGGGVTAHWLDRWLRLGPIRVGP